MDERLGGVVGLAGPADPRAAGGPQQGEQRPHQAARARRPPVGRARRPAGGWRRRRSVGVGIVRRSSALGRRIGTTASSVVSSVGPTRRRSSRHAPSSACSRSATRSAADSMPTDRRMRLARHLERRAGDGRVGHLAGVLDEALDRAERLGEREQLGGGGDPLGGVGAAAHREADHAAEVAHLLGRRGVAGVVGELRVEDPLDGRVADEQVDDGAGVRAVAVHPHGERLDAAQHEVAVERRGHRAGRVLGEAQALGERVVVDGDEAADDVAVAAEVLRGRVHDDVGAERQRLLQVRRGERVVDDDERAVLVGDGGDGLDVDAREQRVGRRLQPDHRRVVGPVARRGRRGR